MPAVKTPVGFLAESQVLESIRRYFELTGSYPCTGHKVEAPGLGISWLAVNNRLKLQRTSLALLKERHFNIRSNALKYDEPLTVAAIVVAIEAFHAAEGFYPKKSERKPVPGMRESWSGLNHALHVGLRDLPRGLTLTKLLENYFGVRNKQNLAKLALPQIVASMRVFCAEHGHCPVAAEPRDVPDMPGETWEFINSALRVGLRGLPGAMSLRRLAEQYLPPQQKQKNVSVGQKLVRAAFEATTGKSFPQTKPAFLRNEDGHRLELDGYCQELAIAFEYQGKQHSVTVKHWKIDELRLRRIQRDDAYKVQRCAELGIRLFVIPYTVPLVQLELYVQELLRAFAEAILVVR